MRSRVVTARYEYHGGFRLRTLRERVKRDLGDGYELDDDRGRASTATPCTRTSAASRTGREGRTRARQDELIDASDRVVGLYKDGRQIGFARAVDCDAAGFVYLADVYVLTSIAAAASASSSCARSIENGPYPDRRWVLHTRDAHASTRSSASAPNERLIERGALLRTVKPRVEVGRRAEERIAALAVRVSAAGSTPRPCRSSIVRWSVKASARKARRLLARAGDVRREAHVAVATLGVGSRRTAVAARAGGRESSVGRPPPCSSSSALGEAGDETRLAGRDSSAVAGR